MEIIITTSKQKIRVHRGKGKVMLEVLLYRQDIVHYGFIPEGKAVNKEMYSDILSRLRDAVRRKYPAMEKRQLISPSRQCFSTPIGFGQGFLNQGQCDNTGASPHSLMT